jgi:hypothetical protein
LKTSGAGGCQDDGGRDYCLLGMSFCSLEYGYQRFRGTCYCHIPDKTGPVAKVYVLFTASRPTLGSTQRPIQRVPRAFSPGKAFLFLSFQKDFGALLAGSSVSSRGAKLNTRLLLTLRLRISLTIEATSYRICARSSISKAFLAAHKLRGFSPQANYTERATAACRRS